MDDKVLKVNLHTYADNKVFTGKFFLFNIQCKCIQSHGLILYADIFPFEKGS